MNYIHLEYFNLTYETIIKQNKKLFSFNEKYFSIYLFKTKIFSIIIFYIF